jgi:hypothetical protein
MPLLVAMGGPVPKVNEWSQAIDATAPGLCMTTLADDARYSFRVTPKAHFSGFFQVPHALWHRHTSCGAQPPPRGHNPAVTTRDCVVTAAIRVPQHSPFFA